MEEILNQFIVSTELKDVDVINILRQYDPNVDVSLPENSLIVSEGENVGLCVYATVNNSKEERYELYPVEFKMLDWSVLEDNLCPLCFHEILSQEEYTAGYCNECGFSWDNDKPDWIWIEKNLVGDKKAE
jgi:hypothetical protein